MTISSFGTPIFNVRNDISNKKIKYLIENVVNSQFLAHKHSHKKNYNRKRDLP